ncbi:hypothetical protein S245_055660 [Arachis hypogaea]
MINSDDYEIRQQTDGDGSWQFLEEAWRWWLQCSWWNVVVVGTEEEEESRSEKELSGRHRAHAARLGFIYAV